MTNLDTFIKDIKNSLLDNNCKIESLSNGERFYYTNEEYGNPLKKCFEKLSFTSHEFVGVRGYDNFKICSVSSSARLCFLYLRNIKDIKIEVELPICKIDTKERLAVAQPDAKEGNKYYECKCQEIVDGEGEVLSSAYIPLLKKYFGIESINISEYGDTISAHLTDFGIDYNEDYDKTHFNVKQFFTHLIGMAEKHADKNDCVELQYIFFTPDENVMSNSTKQVYKELNAEIDKIWNSNMIKVFYKNRPNIKLSAPMFVQVSKKCFASDPKAILISLK